MAPELLLAFAGTALVAVAIWLLESRAARSAATFVLPILLCLCGVILIAVAAVRTGSGLAVRIGAIGTYTAAGAFLGSVAASVRAEREAGPVLASLGTGVATGFKVVSAVTGSLGLLAVFMQLFEVHRPGSLLVIIGQGAFFATMAARSFLMARSPWRLTETGIIGPGAFVSWKDVTACGWRDPNTLAVATTRRFRFTPRGFSVPVLTECRELADVVLASKMAGRT